MKIKFPYGTTADNNQLILPNGQMSVDVESKALRLHDGMTTGGIEIIGRQAFIIPGTAWTIQDSGQTAALRSATYGNGLWVVVGSAGTVITSPDGITWTARDGGFGTENIRQVHFGNGLFVATGYGGGLSTSADGLNWTYQGTLGHGRVHYAAGLWVQVGNPSGKLTTSTDGINWSAETYLSPGETLHGVTYGVRSGNGRWVAVGQNGTVVSSLNGINWTDPTVLSAYDFNDIHFQNGLYVAVGEGGVAFTSNDGIWNWFERELGFNTYSAKSVIASDEGWVVCGVMGKLSTSPDGITWTQHELMDGFSGGLNGAHYANGKFMVVGNDALVATSP